LDLLKIKKAMMNLQIIKTADGSDTIYLSEMDETYHSIFGAVREAKHVFIENGLKLIKKDNISVLEIGFGTGLNALLTAKFAAEKGLNVEYTTIEKFPLDKDILIQLSYAGHSNRNEALYQKIHDAEWEMAVQINANFKIHKIKDDLLRSDIRIKEGVDIIFFDAFAPSKQSEIWDEKIFKLLYQSLNMGGMLVTYSAAGVVKRALRTSGFVVKRLTGPPGKHHILLATKELQTMEK
jgi:tRNA U34 5-methylaminomethyl-2-thiouridine-forming methyltransferase MnmC